MTVIKRFVAGAVCPRCGELDKLRTWRDDSKEYRECVQCRYQDAMRLDGLHQDAELVTRVNQPEPVAPAAKPAPAEQVLTFVPMKSSPQAPKK